VQEEYEGPQLEKLDLSSDGGLGGTSEDVFGPLAVVLVGFGRDEYRQFQAMLRAMEADAVKLIACPPARLAAPLMQVLDLDEVEFEEGPMGLRRTVILSGMYASEVQEVLSAYRDMQLPPAVFAAYVPKNKEKRIVDLVKEVYDDHEYMIEKRRLSREDD